MYLDALTDRWMPPFRFAAYHLPSAESLSADPGCGEAGPEVDGSDNREGKSQRAMLSVTTFWSFSFEFSAVRFVTPNRTVRVKIFRWPKRPAKTLFVPVEQLDSSSASGAYPL